MNIIKEELFYENNNNTDLNDNSHVNKTMIYVLGGNQKDLSGRYKVAAGLYHRNISEKIYFLSREGITEFSPAIRRNLTNDEWSVREMEIHNVKSIDAISVSVPEGIFGTLSEAEAVAEIARRRGCTRLVLVSSVNHTRRVFTTFRSVLSPDPPQIYVYGAEDGNDFDQLLTEYIKLLSYEYFTLPARKILEMLRSAGTKLIPSGVRKADFPHRDARIQAGVVSLAGDRSAITQNRNKNNGNGMVIGKGGLQVAEFKRIQFGIKGAEGNPEKTDSGMPNEDSVGQAHRKNRSMSHALSLGGRMRGRGRFVHGLIDDERIDLDGMQFGTVPQLESSFQL